MNKNKRRRLKQFTVEAMNKMVDSEAERSGASTGISPILIESTAI